MRRVWALAIPLFACAPPPPLTTPSPAPSRVQPAEDSGRLLGFSPLASSSTVSFVASDGCPRVQHPFATPIAVVEDLGIPRWPPVFSFPIAFPRNANLFSLNGFRVVTPDGRTLASQAEVLSRWGDGPQGCFAPIRWAYFHVLAAADPSRRAFVKLVHDPGLSISVGPRVSVTEEPARFIVDTGTARFTIDKKFTGISQIEIGGKIISSGSAFLLEREGVTSGLDAITSLELERAGPHLVTLAAKSFYKNRVFRSTIRLSFWAGSSAVQLDHTYYNGRTSDITAHGGKERVLVDRVYFSLPLASEFPEVVARANERVFRVKPRDTVSIEQQKRSPDRPAVVYAITEGRQNLELGTFADKPVLAIRDRSFWAAATIGHLGPRDPQALRYDPRKRALELDFQSEELFVGGARGIWSRAVLDFGTGEQDLELRGTQLYAHATRPLIGVPSTAYLNTTGARGSLPLGELSGGFARFDEDVDRIHDTTADYLRRYRITGTQLWPDLPRSACNERECAELERGYFEGGDNNYWDWSLVELEQFLRTADPSFIHDFALPEATTMAETISFRPDPGTKFDESSFAGFSPCYGSARGFDGPWLEGLNHRRGACPGDYSYNKVHHLAYVLTADRRFTDFFTQGARTALRMYKDPRSTNPDEWLELSASRTVYQYLEPLLNAAEMGRIGGDEENRRLRDRALVYFDHMAKTSLERGHTCNLLGTRHDDPKQKGDCPSDQAWMLPVWIEWVSRLARLYDHAPARAWLFDFAKMSAARHTVLRDGRPELGKERSQDGWRTMYRCIAAKNAIRDDTCQKVTQIENDGFFYPNGLVAYLNAFALVLDADPKDPLGICRWLPAAYEEALGRMTDQSNRWVWGKELGQAYALTQTALGALERCQGAK